jgi:hypothetical protein
MGRITSSYIARLTPEDVRLSRVGQFIWLRLKARAIVTNLLFCLQQNSSQTLKSAFSPMSRQPHPDYNMSTKGLEKDENI